MPTTSAPTATLGQAGQALRQVLLRLDDYAQKQAQMPTAGAPSAAASNHLRDLEALMTAVQHYEEATLAYLPSVPVQPPLAQLTPAELLAIREADPVYCLGYQRGYRQGAAQSKQVPERVLNLYAQHATLPPPPDCTALMQRVRRHLTELTQRYGSGPIPRHQPPSRYDGSI